MEKVYMAGQELVKVLLETYEANDHFESVENFHDGGDDLDYLMMLKDAIDILMDYLTHLDKDQRRIKAQEFVEIYRDHDMSEGCGEYGERVYQLVATWA